MRQAGPTVHLSVNLNKIALLRNARDGNVPDVAACAQQLLDGGAHGLTVHPRPDQRHIRPDDLPPLAALCRATGREFNVEGNPMEPARPSAAQTERYPGFLPLVRAARPTQCTLVPDASGQRTSDHGFDLQQRAVRKALRAVIAELCAQNIRTSLFLDADEALMPLAAELGAARVELYTGPYASAWAAGGERADEALARCQRAAAAAAQAGLGVNAGHDLNLQNLGSLAAALPELQEVSIGHALTADALRLGLMGAVQAYLDCLAQARGWHPEQA